MSDPAFPAAPGNDDAHDLDTLDHLLDLVHRDEASLLVVDVVWVRDRHRVVGRLANGGELAVPYAPVLVRCGPGARCVRAGMRLRLWRDQTGAHLEHCIP